VRDRAIPLDHQQAAIGKISRTPGHPRHAEPNGAELHDEPRGRRVHLHLLVSQTIAFELHSLGELRGQRLELALERGVRARLRHVCRLTFTPDRTNRRRLHRNDDGFRQGVTPRGDNAPDHRIAHRIYTIGSDGTVVGGTQPGGQSCIVKANDADGLVALVLDAVAQRNSVRGGGRVMSPQALVEHHHDPRRLPHHARGRRVPCGVRRGLVTPGPHEHGGSDSACETRIDVSHQHRIVRNSRYGNVVGEVGHETPEYGIRS
jgi:hypothetical protein